MAARRACSRSRPARSASVVSTEEQLGAWEAAWSGAGGGAGFFRPALLADERICVLAGHDGGQIVAGALVNRSATVIGLSNVFDLGGDLGSAWSAGALAAAELWGDAPIVGYETGEASVAAQRAGFEPVGELVVWIKAA